MFLHHFAVLECFQCEKKGEEPSWVQSHYLWHFRVIYAQHLTDSLVGNCVVGSVAPAAAVSEILK